MKFNTKIRYAIRSMAEIALADQSEGILQKDISENQRISIKYLDHIIASLKAAGLIVNVKGKKSGYRLTKAPAEISMLEIHNAFEHEIAVIECLSEYADCEMIDVCLSYPFWKGLNERVKDYFNEVVLEDLINKRSGKLKKES